MGTTAAGKSALAVPLCHKINGEIISVDSIQVYRHLNIGTTKPSAADKASVPHHLIDITEPAHSYSAGDFCRDAATLINDITTRGKIPVFVGGSMFYFNTLINGLSHLPPTPPAAQTISTQESIRLHKQLVTIAPQIAAGIHPHNAQRVQRYWTIYQHLGQLPPKRPPIPHNMILLALTLPQRMDLYQRIASRFKKMLARGLVDEVITLRNTGILSPNMPAMRAIGYRDVWEYIEGNTSYTEMEERAIAHTRQLAKRQMTWLKHWRNIRWLQGESRTGSTPLTTDQLLDKSISILTPHLTA